MLSHTLGYTAQSASAKQKSRTHLARTARDGQKLAAQNLVDNQ